MSARRATPETSPGATSYASRSLSTPSPAPSPRRSRRARRSADRAAPKQTRKQRKRAKDRPAPLPRLDLDPRPRVAVDLPGEIVGAAGIGGGRLGQAKGSQRLALAPRSAPPASHGLGRSDQAYLSIWAGSGQLRDAREGRIADPNIAFMIRFDDARRPLPALGPKFRGIGQFKAPPPWVDHGHVLVRLHHRDRVLKQSRSRIGDDIYYAFPHGLIRNPDQPGGLRKSRPNRGAPGLEADFAPEIRFAQHRIFGRQPVMLERTDVGRKHPAGEGQPPAPISRAVIGDDQVEIEHQPVELLLAKARPIEQHRPRGVRIFGGNRPRHRRHARIDRLRKLGGDEIVKRSHAPPLAAPGRSGERAVPAANRTAPLFQPQAASSATALAP